MPHAKHGSVRASREADGRGGSEWDADTVVGSVPSPPHADRAQLLEHLRVGRVRASPTTTVVRTVVDDAVERAAIGARTHLLTSRCSQDAVALVDATLLGLALSEVLDNAVRHGPPGTHAHVDVVPSSDGLEIAVADDGPGMSQEVLRSVRALLVDERSGSGPEGHPTPGIGLALASHAARLLDSAFEVLSTATGTMVRLVLPVAAEEAGR